jgi:3-phenylpropionate/cinnamic acid dioxygenase small subunit
MNMNTQDRLDILELISRYAHSYDSNDIEEHVSLFTDDGTLSLRNEATGHAERHKMTGERRNTLATKGIQPRHFLVNTVLTEVSDVEIHGVSNFLITWQFDVKHTPEPQFTGVYIDVFVKTVNGWKFKHREIKIDQKNPRRLSDV